MRGTADAYPFPTLAAPLRFAIALAAVLIVFLADRFAGPLIDDGSKFLLLATAVMASAWLAGSGPALAATVLGAVPGWVHLLRTGKLDQETSARGLASIDRNVRLQAQLTGDLLDVSKALTGELQLDSQPTSLGDAVQQARAAVESAARAKGVTIRSSMADTPAVVLGDERRLRQIAWHLLANAIKFTPGGGTVDLAVGASRGEALLRVSDSAGAIFTARFPLQPAELPGPSPPRPVAVVQAIASPSLDGVRVLVVDQDSEGRELRRAQR